MVGKKEGRKFRENLAIEIWLLLLLKKGEATSFRSVAGGHRLEYLRMGR